MMISNDNKAMVHFYDGYSDFFDIVAGVLQQDILSQFVSWQNLIKKGKLVSR